MKRSRAVGRKAFGPSNPEFQEHAEVRLLISHTFLSIRATPLVRRQRFSLQRPPHFSPPYHSNDPHPRAIHTVSLISLCTPNLLTTAPPLPTRTQVLKLLADISHGSAWSPSFSI